MAAGGRSPAPAVPAQDRRSPANILVGFGRFLENQAPKRAVDGGVEQRAISHAPSMIEVKRISRICFGLSACFGHDCSCSAPDLPLGLPGFCCWHLRRPKWPPKYALQPDRPIRSQWLCRPTHDVRMQGGSGPSPERHGQAVSAPRWVSHVIVSLWEWVKPIARSKSTQAFERKATIYVRRQRSCDILPPEP